jgi:hypothetical protein
MKLIRLVSIAMLCACALAHGQSSDKPAATSDAQKSFNLMKTLAGNWQAPILTDDPEWSKANGAPMSLSIRIASHGNAVIHELNTGGPGLPPFSAYK